MNGAPAYLYWYHQQPSGGSYRSSSASSTGPYIGQLDMTGQPGVFGLVKYVPEAEVAKLAAAMLAKNPPPPVVIDNPDVASIVSAAIKAEREACAKVCDEYEFHFGDDCANAIRARGDAAVKESLTAGQPDAAQAAANQKGR